jgi:hypothetical protein
MLRSKSIFAILLALSFFFSKAQAAWLGLVDDDKVIGYAMVTQVSFTC